MAHHLVKKRFLISIILSLTACSYQTTNNAALIQQRQAQDPLTWQKYVGKQGPSGWQVNVIQPDPFDDGPDGFNQHDWDGDGDLDIFVNFEEGGYSRLYFNPGKNRVRELWTDYIELPKHGRCEDSGIGDLNDDGYIDYIANGGHVFFNPGTEHVRDVKKWTHMTLFKQEARNPVVHDVDGDGLNDLIVGATAWYKQPQKNKQDPNNWQRFEIGEAKWPMTTIVTDIDGDGDADLLVQERRAQGTFYFENPGKSKVQGLWPVQVIDPQIGGMFLAQGDVNGDGLVDLVKAGKKYIHVYLRTTAHQKPPKYTRIDVNIPKQPANVNVEPKPKGVAILEINGDPRTPEIVIIPEYEAQLWYLSLKGPGNAPNDWQNTLMDIPNPESRKKMDNAYLIDIDGDGDKDVATTEENGGWGVIWFENPEK